MSSHLAYQEAQILTRRYARTFYFASWLLPPRKRRHAYAIYAFCRTADSLVDDEPLTSAAQIRFQLDALEAFVKDPAKSKLDYPWAVAFVETQRALGVPQTLFLELLEGVRMDLVQSRYATFEELYGYCYRVAGVVGQMLCYVFGLKDPVSLAYAEKLGVAMQLTNILRDVKEDWERGRVYIPQEVLQQHGYSEANLAARQKSTAYVTLLQSEIKRARAFYQEGAQGISRLPSVWVRATVILMARLYEGILDKIAQEPFANLDRRLALSYGEKLKLALEALLGLSPIGAPPWPSWYRRALLSFLLITPFAVGFILCRPWPALRVWSDSLYLTAWALLALFALSYQSLRTFYWSAFSTMLGLSIEAVGIATGWPFGAYQYTHYLQPQVLGVPVSIALAWAAIVGSYAAIAPPKLRLAYAAFGAVSIDLLLESFATQVMSYWKWQAEAVPPQNYLAWGVIAAILAFFFPSNPPGSSAYPDGRKNVSRVLLVTLVGLMLCTSLFSNALTLLGFLGALAALILIWR